VAAVLALLLRLTSKDSQTAFKYVAILFQVVGSDQSPIVSPIGYTGICFREHPHSDLLYRGSKPFQESFLSISGH